MKEIDKNENINFTGEEKQVAEILEFLKNGPIMTDEQYEEYLKFREEIEKWQPREVNQQ